MSIYLVRHDDVKQTGLCYGQTDFAAAVPYQQTAATIQQCLPTHPALVLTSPLQRCALLAQALYPTANLQTANELKEINFGDWEQTPWSDIPREQIDQWAAQPLNFSFPNGESTEQFHQRVSHFASRLFTQQAPTVVVTHAGVIRLLIALFRNQPWADVLKQPVAFASVWHLHNHRADPLLPAKP